MLVLGSAHAPDLDIPRVLRATFRAADMDVALQVGGLSTYDLPATTYFAAGSQDDLDVIDALRLGRVKSPKVSNVHLLASHDVHLDDVSIGGLSGTYSAGHYRRPRARLYQEHRRHFTHAEVERAKTLDVDVFLTHEPPVGVFEHEAIPDEEGCRKVNEVLSAVRPSLCLVGKPRVHARAEVGATTLVSLAPAWNHYYTLDTEKMTLARHETPEE